MPTFNRLEYIGPAVESVYAQSFEDWELIIVDDGSDDKTRSYLRSRQDSRTSVLYHDHTGTPAVIRNIGIRNARGRLIAFLDSDDTWMPDKLQRQVDLMSSNPEARWSYTGVRIVDSDHRTIEESLFSSCVPYAGAITAELLTFQAKVAAPSVMAEASFVRELGGFDERLRFGEDYDLWLRMSMASPAAVDPAPLCAVRRHGNHFTDNRVECISGLVSLYRKMERLAPTRALQAISRKQLGIQLFQLAAQHAREKNWGAMRNTLAAAARENAWHLKGWLRVLKAATFPTLRIRIPLVRL